MPLRHTVSCFRAAAGVALAVVLCAAQEASTVSQFLSDANLVLVPVTVADRRSANILGLAKESFAILDDGRPQPITVFYVDDAPCSVGLVLDVSGSMNDTLSLGKAAVHAFLAASNPEDEFFLATVSSDPKVLTRPLSDVTEIEDLVRHQYAGGSTALFDTIHTSLTRDPSRRSHRRALLVISDGMDNHSRYTKADVMRAVMKATRRFTRSVSPVRGRS